jgi:hypothetical protein
VSDGKRHEPRRGLVDVVLREGDLVVLLLPLLLLGAGVVARDRLVGKTSTYAGHGVRLTHPASWAARETDGGATVTDLFAPSRVKPQVMVRVEPLPAGVDASMATDFVVLNLGRERPLHHTVAQRAVKVGGRDALRIESAYAIDPSTGGARSDVPQVVRAIDLVLLQGGQVTRVGVIACVEDYERHRARYEAIMESVVLQ